MIIDEIRDMGVRQSPDQIITTFKAASLIAVCLIPTFIILIVLHTINRHKLIKRFKIEQSKKEKNRKDIEQIYMDTRKMEQLLGKLNNKPSSKIAYYRLSLGFNEAGRIVDN